MKDVLKFAGWVIGIIFLITLLNLGYYKFFAPMFENARREVFEKTHSYNQAKLQDLAKYKLEYERADSNDQEALASVIRHRFADYDGKKLPVELNQFLTSIRGY